MPSIFQFCCLLLVPVCGTLAEGHGYHKVQRRSVRKAASIGGSKIMECEIEYPGGNWVEHIIQWQKQGIEVPIFIQFNGYPPHIDAGYQGRIRLVEQASIEVSDIRMSDEGWYECRIIFLDGNDESNTNGTWIYLSVNSPPVIGEVSPGFLIKKEGETVDMFCEAYSTPEPVLSWYKDDKPLEPSQRISISGNRVQIRQLVRTDGGVYKCTFKNVVGQANHEIKLVIEGQDWITKGNAYIMVPPKNTTADEGTRIKLTCQAEGFPNNISYRWYKNGEEIQSIAGLMTRAAVYADGSFVISTVIKEDTGWYKCRPSNGLGPPPEASAYLNVTYLPRVLNMPHTLYLPRGMEGHIECPVEANPPVTQVVWTQNERRLNDSKRLKVGRGGTLLIKAVNTGDEGRYTCTPYSPRGAGRSSSVVQIFVKDPPHFVVRPKPYYQRQLMQLVIMPCVAEGDPPPEIIWRKADNTFPPQHRVERSGGNLTIVNLDKEDHGTYECVAKNVVTSVITSTLLIIEMTTPHAPYNVTVEPDSTKAKISWMPAYDGGYAQHYVLWYRMQATGSDTWLTLRVPNEATSITLYKLLPGKTYQFCILSRNRLGDGLFSNIVSAQTTGYEDVGTVRPNLAGSTHHPGHPEDRGLIPGPPRNVSVRRENGGLMISWLPPLNNTVPVQYYKVMYRTVGQWVPLADRVVGQTWYKWPTVSRGAQYLFQVYSHGNGSEGAPSKVVTHFTIDPMKVEGMSNAMIGGVVGGLIFLFIAVILAVMAIKFFSKRRQRERAARYGNVKYFGPKQVEANKNSMHQQLRFGRGSAVKVAWKRMRRGMKKKHSPPDQKHLTPGDAVSSSWLCLRQRGKQKKKKYEVDVYHPIQTISRTSDGRFVLDDGFPHPQSHSSHPGHPVSSVTPLQTFTATRDSISPRNDYNKDFDLPQDYLSRRHNTKLSNGPIDGRRDQVLRDYPTQSYTRPQVEVPLPHTPRSAQRSDIRSPGAQSYHTPLGAGWYDDPYFQQGKSPYRFGAWRDQQATPVRDGVIIRPDATPSNQTYLTSSPDQNASNTTPFIISDISSVNPSFSTNGERSHNTPHGNIVISDSSIGRDWSGEGGVQPPGEHQWNYPLPGDYYRQVRHLAGQYGHPMDSPGSVALYQIPESQGSSPDELAYTREHLDKAIQRVRAGHTPQGSMDSTEQPNAISRNTQRQPANFRTSVAPYKNYVLSGSTSSSGVGSGPAVGSRPGVYQRHLSSPNSSGIGSRENSHSTGSVSHATAEPWEGAQPFPTPTGLNSTPMGGLQSVDDFNNNNSNNSEWYRTPQPRQPRRDFKDYADSQERCRRLKEEYLAFQQSRHSGDTNAGQGTYVHEIESEML